jgi:hypothetical protein
MRNIQPDDFARRWKIRRKAAKITGCAFRIRGPACGISLDVIMTPPADYG